MKIHGLRLKIGGIDRVLELLGDEKIAIGWSEVGNLTDTALTRSDFRSKLKVAYPDLTSQGLTAATTGMWRFAREMSIGDILVIPHKNDIYFAKVAGPLRHVQEAVADDMAHQRKIVPLLGGKPLRRHELPGDLRDGLRFRSTTADLSFTDQTVAALTSTGPAEPLEARETSGGIRRGLKAWEAAFRSVGRNDHGFSEKIYWIDNLGMGLLNQSWKRNGKYRHWYGLIDRLGSRQAGNLIVEVNPPDAGAPGRWQGIVARDGDGREWILHRGELNVDSRRVQLKQEPDADALAHRTVKFADGMMLDCYVVAILDGDAWNIARQTRRFVDVCLRVRTKYQPNSDEFRDSQILAQKFEESIGTTVVPPQPRKEIDRYHARVWHGLRDALRAMNFKVHFDRVSALGPDLYTVCDNAPYLFEIKTQAGSSDCLKGVGQLIVYEHVLGRKFNKMLVLPNNVARAFVPVLDHLGISVVLYEQIGVKFRFDWPKGFLKKG